MQKLNVCILKNILVVSELNQKSNSDKEITRYKVSLSLWRKYFLNTTLANIHVHPTFINEVIKKLKQSKSSFSDNSRKYLPSISLK